MARSIFGERNNTVPERGDRFTFVYSMLGLDPGSLNVFQRFSIGPAVRDNFAAQAQIWRVLDVDFRADDRLAFVSVQWEIQREDAPGLTIGSVAGSRIVGADSFLGLGEVSLQLNDIIRLDPGDPVGDPFSILERAKDAAGDAAKAAGGFVIGSLRISLFVFFSLVVLAVVFREDISKFLTKATTL